MLENLPMPSFTDPDPTHCPGVELTRTNSDSDSSAITLDTSKDVWLHCDNAIQVDFDSLFILCFMLFFFLIGVSYLYFM